MHSVDTICLLVNLLFLPFDGCANNLPFPHMLLFIEACKLLKSAINDVRGRPNNSLSYERQNVFFEVGGVR